MKTRVLARRGSQPSLSQKPDSGGKGFGGMKGNGKGYGKNFPAFGYMKGGFGFGKGYGKQVKVHGEPDQMVYVGNLPFKS